MYKNVIGDMRVYFQRKHVATCTRVLQKSSASLRARKGAIMINAIYREFYMSAHVSLNLLNELRKRDKMRNLLSILSFFRNELKKINNRTSDIRFYLSYDIKII